MPRHRTSRLTPSHTGPCTEHNIKRLLFTLTVSLPKINCVKQNPSNQKNIQSTHPEPNSAKPTRLSYTENESKYILETKAKRGANITDKDRGPSTTATTPGRGPRVPRRRGHHARTRNCMVVTAGMLHPAGAMRRACAGPYTGAQNL